MASLGSGAVRLAETINVSRSVFCVENFPNDVTKMCSEALKHAEKSAFEGMGSIENCLIPDLDLFTVAHEEAQLRCALEAPQTARNGKAYTERDCARGEDCVGFFIPGGPGKPLVECLNPQDYFSMREFSTLPQDREPCVLCRRDAVGTAVAELSLDAADARDEPFRLCQVYRNQCHPDTDPQTYRKECCIHPAQIGKKWNGLVAPIVMFDKSYYNWYYNESQKTFSIDQSVVVNQRKVR